MRRCPPATSWHPSTSAACSLGPFAMYVALPRSDYYGPSAPPPGHQPTVGLPALVLAARGGGRPGDGSRVHRVSVDRIGAQLCRCSLAVGYAAGLPRQPPHRRTQPASESLPSLLQVNANCCPARIHQVGAGSTVERVQPLVHSRYASRSCLPGPDRLAVPARPVVVRAACRPPLHLQGQAALSFTRLLRQPGEAGLSPASAHTAPHGALPRRGTRRGR